jgi:hypothetical protein
MTNQRGQLIIELLLATALSLIVFPALFTMFYLSREGKPQQLSRTKAVAWATEAEEALRSVRENGWDQLLAYANNTAYHPVRSATIWGLGTGTETVNGYTRSITFSQVSRDSNGAIVTSGGTVDPSTRRATIAVSWATPLPTTISLVEYLTRHNNFLKVDTTTADFTAGTTLNTRVVTLTDGDVVLGSTGGFGDWCTPSLTISALDLPKSGVANAISAIQGQIAGGTGDNASGVSYANVLVSDPSFPTNPTASISGTFDGYKTNDVFTEQNYAYLATDTNSKEVEIISLAGVDGFGKYSEAGYFNAPGNGNANSVATSGNVGYMIGGTKLYSFDLSSKSGSRPALDADGVTLPGTGNRLMIVGSRAFVTTSATNAQLVIVDISDPTNLRIADQVSLSGQGGKAIFVNGSGTRAYVATAQSASLKELFIVNVDASSAGYKQVLGTYDTNGMDPTGVVVVSGPRAIIVGHSAEEYQVVDITTETANPLPRCGGLQIDTGVNGVSTVQASSGRAYSYIVTGDASTELKIIEGGPGANGHDYVLNGTFTSQAFDVSTIATGSAKAAYNRLTASITKPSSVTDVKLQFAAADPVSNSCGGATYVYVGPDGTTGTYYTSSDNATIAGALPFSGPSGYKNPARCFRYQGQFTTTDQSLTPILSEVTISLSP